MAEQSATTPSSLPAAAERTASANPYPWLELTKAVALPLVTLLLGFLFNYTLTRQQARDGAQRLYIEMMANRERADSDLRKDMFNSILSTFMDKTATASDVQLRQKVLNLELLAYNFHESLDVGPLFKDVRRRVPEDGSPASAELRERLEKVAHEVIERQLTTLSTLSSSDGQDAGGVEQGDAPTRPINDLKSYVFWGASAVPDEHFASGEGVSRLCLSMESSDKVRHHRQFRLEPIRFDPVAREVQVRLYVSRVIAEAQCHRPDLDLTGYAEIDTNFWVGLFDFPMIDNTRLSEGERCSVSLTAVTPESVKLALAYFPGSRASLKDKPYYDEVVQQLVPEHKADEALGANATRRRQ